MKKVLPNNSLRIEFREEHVYTSLGKASQAIYMIYFAY